MSRNKISNCLTQTNIEKIRTRIKSFKGNGRYYDHAPSPQYNQGRIQDFKNLRQKFADEGSKFLLLHTRIVGNRRRRRRRKQLGVWGALKVPQRGTGQRPGRYRLFSTLRYLNKLFRNYL